MCRNLVQHRGAILIFVPFVFGFLMVVSCRVSGEDSLPKRVDFNYHIKPILSDRCFACHGPDENALKADFHLNIPEDALNHHTESGRMALVPGDPDQSDVYHRIVSKDPDFKMPPPESDLELSEHEITLLTKWIEQGAEYKPHWAFTIPQKHKPPKVRNSKWVNNPIDQFVLKTLKDKKMKPSPEARKDILLRRVSLDLTGLPPAVEEIDDFLKDDDENAFEKVVERLLASPRYGERMALEWLDVARYADSHGYSTDGYRMMWPWRDWVIKAFNDNMPLDQFIIWQLAGDKLPNATQEQKLATAFLRNQRMNAEGGIILEEYMHEYAADRTETFSTAFLGLTMQCAKCHDHKYDPFSQKDYFQLYSYFNQVNERGIVQNDHNSGPQVHLTTPEIDSLLTQLNHRLSDQEKKLETAEKDLNLDYLKSINSTKFLRKKLLVDADFNGLFQNKFRNKAQVNSTINARGAVQRPGFRGQPAYHFTAYNFCEIRNKELNFARSDPFTISLWLNSNHENEYMIVLNNTGGKNNSYIGYEFAIVHGHPTIRLIHSKPANLIDVRTKNTILNNKWTHLSISYDGSARAEGITFYWNGVQAEMVVNLDQLTKSMVNAQSVLRIGGRNDYQVDTRGNGLIDDLKIYGRELSALEIRSLYQNRAASAEDFPLSAQKKFHLSNRDKAYQNGLNNVRKIREEINLILDSLPRVMVMEDIPESRTTYVLERGVYNARGEIVQSGLPTIFANLSKGTPNDRLGLARWVVGKSNPLTARVIVNRYWQMYFGRGLVNTTEDFGNQGALPSHPELLDWLACYLMESGWDTKGLQKLIVTSSTYRQSSSVSREKREVDPENIFLSRGPSFRLQAELIRDCALAASGLLSDSIGGASAKPYQPKGLWSEKNSFGKLLLTYNQDEGDQLYRRGLYTFWRRTSPPPSMITFDAPTRDNCIVKREQTNTPLQALVLLNDPQFVEASRVMAEDLIRTTTEEEDRIIKAYRRLTSLNPNDRVVNLLIELYREQIGMFKNSPDLAADFQQIGNAPADSTLSNIEVAALGVVCNTILSFDETIVKR